MSAVENDAEVQMNWTRWLNRRTPAARDHLIVHYSPLVEFLAKRVKARLPASVDIGDLISSGVFGLIDAIERFDVQRGVKFETFAAPRIRGAIYDGIRQLDWVPRTVRSRARKVEFAFSELEHRLGRSPSNDELSTHLDVTPEELEKWFVAIATVTVGPLDRVIESGDEPFESDDAEAGSPSTAVEVQELSQAIRQEIDKLPEREKLVLSMYYDDGLTLAEIGEVLGLSGVGQIHTKSVLHLRSRLADAGLS